MGIFDWLKGDGGSAEPTFGEAESVRKIASELRRFGEDRARYLAAFAYVLGRAAYADGQISAVEREAMQRIVEQIGQLSAEEARLTVRLAAEQTQRQGGTEDYVVTREFRRISTVAQRRQLLDCLLAVCAADDTITGEEDAQLRQIASELGFDHRQYVEARLPYSEKRAVIKGLPTREG